MSAEENKAAARQPFVDAFSEGKEGAEKMPKFILAVAVWLAGTHRPRSNGAKAGWLSRHSSRPSRPRGPGEPYVDLSSLDLTRRH